MDEIHAAAPFCDEFELDGRLARGLRGFARVCDARLRERGCSMPFGSRADYAYSLELATLAYASAAARRTARARTTRIRSSLRRSLTRARLLDGRLARGLRGFARACGSRLRERGCSTDGSSADYADSLESAARAYASAAARWTARARTTRIRSSLRRSLTRARLLDGRLARGLRGFARVCDARAYASAAARRTARVRTTRIRSSLRCSPTRVRKQTVNLLHNRIDKSREMRYNII